MSADNIVPNPTDPQNLNRFSYTLNNPLRYTDPTGHRACDDFDSNGQCVTESGGGGMGFGGLHPKKPKQEKDDSDKPKRLVDNPYCEGDFNTCAANLTQDLATFVDVAFGATEVVLVAAGCVAGGPAGCQAGLLTSWSAFNIAGNPLENALSGASLGFTAYSDYSDDHHLNRESTQTSFITFVVGGMSTDPIADAIIDGYASGYNHGLFNGLLTIFNGGSLLHSP